MPKTGTFPSSAATVRSASFTAAGSPGPLVRKTPLGRFARTSSTGVAAGTTVTRQPASTSSWIMAFFRP